MAFVFVLGWLAPLFLLFEMAQLFVAARYLGIEQIHRGVHPLAADPRGPRWVGALWLVGLLLSYLFQALLLNFPRTALPGLLMLCVSFLGLSLRRVSGLKWALVVLTFEGALRAGFLIYVFISVIINPHWRGWPGWLPGGG